MHIMHDISQFHCAADISNVSGEENIDNDWYINCLPPPEDALRSMPYSNPIAHRAICWRIKLHFPQVLRNPTGNEPTDLFVCLPGEFNNTLRNETNTKDTLVAPYERPVGAIAAPANCLFSRVCIHVCMYVCIMYVCICMCMYVCPYVCMYVCMYVYVYVCMYVFFYMYGWMGGWTDTCYVCYIMLWLYGSMAQWSMYRPII